MICTDMNSIKPLLRKLMQKNERDWGFYLILRDNLFKKMSEKGKQDILNNSLKCAENEYYNFIEKFGQLIPSQYAEKLLLKVQDNNDKIEEMFMYFSLYNSEPPTITISETAMLLIKQVIEEEELKDILMDVNLKELAIAHEIFHHIESITPNIYTRHKNVSIFKFKSIKYEACAACASEIAAVHFSKMLTGLSYSPSVLGILLAYSYSKDIKKVENLIESII